MATFNSQNDGLWSAQATWWKLLAIIDIDGTAFRVEGDWTSLFTGGQTIVVTGSAGNNGTYTVVSSSLSGGSNTNIEVVEAIPGATAPLGFLQNQGGTPGAGDDVYIVDHNVAMNVDLVTGTDTLNSLHVGSGSDYGASTSSTLTMTTGSIDLATPLFAETDLLVSDVYTVLVGLNATNFPYQQVSQGSSSFNTTGGRIRFTDCELTTVTLAQNRTVDVVANSGTVVSGAVTYEQSVKSWTGGTVNEFSNSDDFTLITVTNATLTYFQANDPTGDVALNVNTLNGGSINSNHLDTSGNTWTGSWVITTDSVWNGGAGDLHELFIAANVEIGAGSYVAGPNFDLKNGTAIFSDGTTTWELFPVNLFDSSQITFAATDTFNNIVVNLYGSSKAIITPGVTLSGNSTFNIKSQTATVEYPTDSLVVQYAGPGGAGASCAMQISL